MDAMQIAIPVVGIIAAAAVTFYVVSFSELREKSFQALDDSDDTENGSYKFYASSREKRARRKADRAGKPRG